MKDKIQRVSGETVQIKPYDPGWVRLFEEEKAELQSCFADGLIKRVEHFGSTAVPNLAAKPIIDMLVEVTSLVETREKIAPVLESRGYDYFWRPSEGDDVPPFYAWFIKRGPHGERSHHIHMVEADFVHWESLLFRDYLIDHSDVADEYENLKYRLARNYHNDRIAYTKAKTEFIRRITRLARHHYEKGQK